MSNLITDSIIGHDLLQQHKSVTFEFRRKKKNCTFQQLCRLPAIPYADLFRNITRNR